MECMLVDFARRKPQLWNAGGAHLLMLRHERLRVGPPGALVHAPQAHRAIPRACAASDAASRQCSTVPTPSYPIIMKKRCNACKREPEELDINSEPQ